MVRDERFIFGCCWVGGGLSPGWQRFAPWTDHDLDDIDRIDHIDHLQYIPYLPFFYVMLDLHLHSIDLTQETFANQYRQ